MLIWKLISTSELEVILLNMCGSCPVLHYHLFCWEAVRSYKNSPFPVMLLFGASVVDFISDVDLMLKNLEKQVCIINSYFILMLQDKLDHLHMLSERLNIFHSNAAVLQTGIRDDGSFI